MSKSITQDILLRARKDNLMKNKKIIGLMSVLLATGLIVACSPGGNASTSKAPDPTTAPTTGPTSSDPGSSSTTPVVNKYTVRFLVDGNVVKTYEVEEGKTVTYDGDTPTKEADSEAPKYRFKGWDKDVTQPITADTDFNAEFEKFAFEVMIDDFESYQSAGDLADNGWESLKYSDKGWEPSENAKLRVAYNVRGGTKALGYNTFRNDMAFMARKSFNVGSLEGLVNAFKFSLQVPKEMYEVSVLVYVPIEIEGVMTQAPLKYVLAKDEKTVSSEEYIDYVIPFSDVNWQLWDTTDSLVNIAEYYGIDAADLPAMINQFAVSVKGTSVSNSDCYVYVDEVGFTTIADDAGYSENEKVAGIYDRYTMAADSIIQANLNIDYATMKANVDIPAAGQALPGDITIDGRNITFKDAYGGAILTYKGRLTNGNQKIKFVEATGSIGEYVQHDLNAVQVVDDFESYTESGVAYYQNNTPADRSGLRGAYYQEYRNDSMTTTSPWHSDKSSLMGGDGSQMNLLKDPEKAHGGNQYASMKISSGNIMRYMTYGLFDGTAESTNSYRGKYLSFWLKSNIKLTTLRVRFYFITNPDGTTMANNCNKSGQVDISPNKVIDEWTRYQVELDPNKIYFGFNFQIHQSWVGDGQLYVDDVEVFNENPYVSLPTGITLSDSTATLDIGNTKQLTAKLTPQDVVSDLVTWSSDKEEIATVSSTGLVTAKAEGKATITAETFNGLTATCEVTVNAAPVTIKYPTGTFVSEVKAGGQTVQLAIALGTKANGMVAVRASNTDAQATGVTFDETTGKFEITTTGSFQSMTFGKITGTYDQTNDKLTGLAVDGTIKAAVSSISDATRPLHYEALDEDTAGLQAKFNRRYNSGGGWQFDNSNADRFTSDTTNFVSGTGAMKRRGFSGGPVANTFKSDFASPIAAKNIQFWVYNPSATDRVIRMWYYKGAGLTNNGETGTVTAKANSWTYCAMGFAPGASIYNFQIADFTNSGTYFTFDDISLF